jgi:hypothetical protein
MIISKRESNYYMKEDFIMKTPKWKKELQIIGRQAVE